MKKLTIEQRKRQFYKRTDEAKKLRNKRGVFKGPTGVGKGTIIEAKNVSFFKKKSKKIKISISVAHRIILCQQTMERIVKALIKSGQRPSQTRIAIHSGQRQEYNLDKELDLQWIGEYPDKQLKNSQALLEEIKRSVNLGTDVLLATTYHSLPITISALEKLGSLRDMIEIEVFGDEIHHLQNEQWYKAMEKLKKLVEGFFGFTATPGKMRAKLEKLFDKFIWEMNDKEAIDLGLKVKPVYHVAEVSGDREKNVDQGVKAVFEKFERMLNIPVKLLVHCNNTWELYVIGNKKSQVMELRTKYNDLMVAEISSRRGHRINGVEYKNRLDWLQTIINHNGRLIVMHIDIINSGIDVPGFTNGVWTKPPVREIRQKQGDGRSERLHIQDRPRLERQEISTLDRSEWIKGYSYSSCLSFSDTSEQDIDAFTDLVVASRDDGYDPEDTLVDGTSSKVSRDDEEEIHIPLQSKVKAQIKHKIENIKAKEKKQKEIDRLLKFRKIRGLENKLDILVKGKLKDVA